MAKTTWRKYTEDIYVSDHVGDCLLACNLICGHNYNVLERTPGVLSVPGNGRRRTRTKLPKTRPDRAFEHPRLSKFVQHTGVKHLESVERAVQYVRATYDHGITF